MADNILRIGAEFDVSGIVAGTQEASAAFDGLGTKVGDASAKMLNELYPAEEEAQAQTGSLSEAILALTVSIDKMSGAGKAAAGSVNGISGAMSKARFEAGALDGSMGMMVGGLARIAAGSEIIGPLMQAAFAPLLLYAFVQIAEQVGDAIQKISDDMVGYTKAVQDAEKADIKWSQANEARALTLDQAHQKLNSTLKETAGNASETFGQKWVAASEQAMHATTGLGVALAVLKDPFKLFTPIGQFFTAEEASANRAVQLANNYDKLIKDTYTLSEAHDRAAISINSAKEAADKAATGGAANARVQQLQIEIAALAEKQRLEEQIARTEIAAKGGGPTEQAAAAKPISDEYGYKRIELQNELRTAQQEYAREQAAQADQAIDEFNRLRLAQEKLGDSAQKIATEEAELFQKSGTEQIKIQVEALGKLIDAQKKSDDELEKMEEENSIKRIEAKEREVQAMARLEESRRPEQNPLAHAETMRRVGEQEVVDLRKLEEEKYRIQIEYMQKQLADTQTIGVVQTPAQYEAERSAVAKLYAEIEKLKIEHNAKMAGLDNQAASNNQKAVDAMARAWKPLEDSVTRGMQNVTRGVLDGTVRMSEGFRRMGVSMVQSVIEGFEKMLVHAAISEIQMLVMHMATNQAKVASDAEAATQSKTISALAGLKQVVHAAAVAASNTYAAVSAIPIIGPFIAPPAAAGAFAAVMAFEGLAGAKSGAYIPTDMPIFAHAGETVVSPSETVSLRQMAANGGSNGGDTHVHMNVNALDSKSVSDFLHSNRGQFVGMIQKAVRNGVRLR